MKIQHACVGMTRKLRFESNVISYGNQTEDTFISFSRFV